MLNVGQGLNPVLGVFTAPQNGVYLFAIDGIGYTNFIPLRINGEDYKYFVTWSENWEGLNGFTTVVLREGDQVTLLNVNSNLRGDGVGLFTFYGALLY